MVELHSEVFGRGGESCDFAAFHAAGCRLHRHLAGVGLVVLRTEPGYPGTGCEHTDQEGMAGTARSNFPRCVGRLCSAAREHANHEDEGCMRTSALASDFVGRHASDKWRAESRSEPDSGNPAVRDRRGALRNVAMGAGLRPGAKAPELSPDPTVRALNFYPDHRTYGLKGGWGTGLARAPRP